MKISDAAQSRMNKTVDLARGELVHSPKPGPDNATTADEALERPTAESRLEEAFRLPVPVRDDGKGPIVVFDHHFEQTRPMASAKEIPSPLASGRGDSLDRSHLSEAFQNLEPVFGHADYLGLALLVRACIPESDGRFAVDLSRSPLHARVSEAIEDLSTSTLRPPGVSWTDIDEYRYKLLVEAVRWQDYAFIFLNQWQCNNSIENCDEASLFDKAISALARLFALAPIPSPGLRAFFSSFPVDRQALSETSSLAPAAALPNSLDALFIQMQTCSRKERSTWAGQMAACIRLQVPPLAHDLAISLSMSSFILQRLTFGHLMREMLPDADPHLHDAASQIFTESQRYLQAKQSPPADYPLTLYCKLAALVSGRSVAPTELSSLLGQFPTYYHLDWPSPETSKQPFEAVGSKNDRHNPGSFCPNAINSAPTSIDGSVVYVQGFVAQPTRLSTEYKQTFTFDLDADAIRDLRTRSRSESGHAACVYSLASRGWRLRCCYSSGPMISTEGDWLAQEMVCPPWLYVTVNSHQLPLPKMSDIGRYPAYDLAQVILLGTNTITFHLNRLAESIYKIIDEIKQTRTVSTSQMIGVIKAAVGARGLTQRTVFPDEASEGSITIRLRLPSPGARIFDIPARSRRCNHVHPFDLLGFLRKRATSERFDLDDDWRCPICYADARPSELVIDEYLVELRKGLEENERLDAGAVVVNEEGIWSVLEQS